MVELIGVDHRLHSPRRPELIEKLRALPPGSVIALELTDPEAVVLQTLHQVRMFLANRDPAELEKSRGLIRSLRLRRRTRVSFGKIGRKPVALGNLAEAFEKLLDNPNAPPDVLRRLVPHMEGGYFTSLGLALLRKGHEIVGIDPHKPYERSVRILKAADRKAITIGAKFGSQAHWDLSSGLVRIAFQRSKSMARQIGRNPRITHVIVGGEHAVEIARFFRGDLLKGHSKLDWIDQRTD